MTNIPHAVTFLGVDVLKQLVVTAEIFRAFQPRCHIDGFSLDAVQSHSHVVAAIAAGKLPLPKATVPTATIAALLHDAGKLVMASRLPLECERIRRLTIGGQLTFPAAEVQVLGAHACRDWRLPPRPVGSARRNRFRRRPPPPPRCRAGRSPSLRCTCRRILRQPLSVRTGGRPTPPPDRANWPRRITHTCGTRGWKPNSPGGERSRKRSEKHDRFR